MSETSAFRSIAKLSVVGWSRNRYSGQRSSVPPARSIRVGAFERTSRLVLMFDVADIRQAAPFSGEVDPVADYKFLPDLESKVIHIDLGFQAFRFEKERDAFERSRPPGFESVHDVAQRQARIDDILDHDDMAVLQGLVHVKRKLYFARADHLGAIARNTQKLAGERQVEL